MDPTSQGAALRRRKDDHLAIALEQPDVPRTGAGWGDVQLVHEALPEVDLCDVDLGTELLGRRLAMPVVIAGMTGGSPRSLEVNAALGRAAQRHGVAMGVGSQRAALVDPALAQTYAVAREHAPDAMLVANLGAAQLIRQRDRGPVTLAECRAAIAMISADALAVHLNFVEELVQPEGDRRTRGCAAALKELAGALDVPVIAKETGGGLSPSTARRLVALGVSALDVGGAGGTDFARIEKVRAERAGDERGALLGPALEGWGIPTAVSVAGAQAAGVPVIATGGVRSGVDAAKAICLGATAVGIGRPLLAAAMSGDEAVDAWFARFADELRAVMLLTGCRTVAELMALDPVVTGPTARWLEHPEWVASALRAGPPDLEA